MASSTKNVRLGVCRVRFGGVDLGYTKGGVNFVVATQTHQVVVDQFGTSEINDIIMGRTAKITCPLAETTLENLVRVMPGSTYYSDGRKGKATITIGSAPGVGDSVTINGVTLSFKVSPAAVTDVLIGDSALASAANLLTMLQSSANPALAAFNYTSSTSGMVITATYGTRVRTVTEVAAVNAIALAKSGTSITVDASVTGQVIETKSRVDVTRSVGTSLLDISQELILHPTALADNDFSQDVIFPKTATAGDMSFDFKVDSERLYNISFNAYPDTNNGGTLFQVGDKTVTSTSVSV